MGILQKLLVILWILYLAGGFYIAYKPTPRWEFVPSQHIVVKIIDTNEQTYVSTYTRYGGYWKEK